jgi:hypothetical protein
MLPGTFFRHSMRDLPIFSTRTRFSEHVYLTRLEPTEVGIEYVWSAHDQGKHAA